MSHRTYAAARWLPLLAFLTFPTAGLAYVGPGAGLSLIGSLLAFLAAIVVAIFGFLFFPIRRLLRKRKERRAARSAEQAATRPNPAEPSAQSETATGDRRRDPKQK